VKKQHSHRMKSTHIALLCCLVTALSICCQQQAEITDDSPSLLLDGVNIEVLVNDNLDGSPVTAGLVRNNSDKLYSFHTMILYYNDREKLIGTYSSIVLDLYPGTEQAFYVFPPEDWSRAARVDVKVTNIIKAEETSITPDFEFGNISVYHHEHGTRVLGEVTNRGNDWQYSINVLGAVVDADGKIKKANVHMIENLYPGETRMFAVDVVGEDTDATDGRVYLESIFDVVELQARPDIAFSNLRMAYIGDIDRTSVLCDIVNHDERGYRNARLLIGVYEEGRLTNLTWSSVSRISAGETIPFDQMLFDGNLADKEVRIHIDHVEVDE
jgi:hypothetical protein